MIAPIGLPKFQRS